MIILVKISKQMLVFILFFFIALPCIAEEYICSLELSSLDRAGEVEMKTLLRKSNYFIRTNHEGEQSIFNILHETQSFIMLTQTYEYPSLFFIIIDKNNC